MSRAPDFWGHAFQKIVSSLLTSGQQPAAELGGQSQHARSGSSESPPLPSPPETGTSSARFPDFTIAEQYQAFEALPGAISHLSQDQRASLLEIHTLVMQALKNIHDPHAYASVRTFAHQEFGNDVLSPVPSTVKVGFFIYWNVLRELYLLKSDIETFVKIPDSNVSERANSLLTIPSGRIALSTGVLVLFLSDITHALQGRVPYSFPDLVRLTTPLDQRPQNADDFITWQSLLHTLSQNKALSSDFTEIFGILFQMLGYYPSLTFEEQCYFVFTQDQNSLPPYFHWFQGHIQYLFSHAKGLLAAGLGEIVFRNGKGLERAFKVLPKDFFAPWPIKYESTFKKGPVLDDDGDPLTFCVRPYGMYWEYMGDLLRDPRVKLNQALQAAEGGLLIPWSTWARYAQALKKHQEDFWGLVFAVSDKEIVYPLTIAGVHARRSSINSLFPTRQEGWLRYLRWCNDSPLHASSKSFNTEINPWKCIAAVRKHCKSHGLADLPVALWFIAPFEKQEIPEYSASDFLEKRLRNLLVSLWQVDSVFFRRDPIRYKELRCKVFGSDAADSVGGLVCHLGLEQLSPIFQNPINDQDHTRGVWVTNSDGSQTRRRVTAFDLCSAANVRVHIIEIDGVKYECLVPNPDGQRSLDNVLLEQINKWVNVAREQGEHRLSSTGGAYYDEMSEIYDVVMLFYLLNWECVYGEKRTKLRDKMAMASVEPAVILSRLKPLRYNTATGEIDVDDAAAIAGPLYGMGPLKVYEEVMRIVTEAPYGTTLCALSPEVLKRVHYILNPRPVKDSSGNYVRDSQNNLILVVRVADPHYQDPTSRAIPPGFMNYEDFIRFPSRSLVNILEAISRGNPACKAPCPGFDQENILRRPMPLSNGLFQTLWPLVTVSPEAYIREAFRLARVRLGGDATEADIVREAEDIWSKLRLYDRCGPADMHRVLQSLKIFLLLPPWFEQLLRDAFHLNIVTDPRGVEYTGHVARLYEALRLAGIRDQELAESFRLSSGEQVAAELASATVRDFVPVGGNIVATFLGLASKFQETVINAASQTYRFSLPASLGTFAHLVLRSSFPYHPTDLAMWTGIGLGFVWYFGLLVPRYFARSQLRRLNAFAHACGLHNPPLDPKRISEQFTSQVNSTYVTSVGQ